jgi:hypothetical protein
MFLGWIAPGLSRAAGMASPRVCCSPNGGLEPILGECHPHGAAQIRRGIAVRGSKTVSAPRFLPHRVFVPTELCPEFCPTGVPAEPLQFRCDDLLEFHNVSREFADTFR